MTFTDSIQQELSRCIDLFLPAACPWCGVLLSTGKGHKDLCPACLENILSPGPACCPCCMQAHATLSASNHRCEACLRNPPPFDKVHVVGRHAGKLKEAIHRFKYRDNPALNASLGRLLTRHLDNTLADFRPDLVIPVPSHPQRLKRRGYNQALELARPVAQHLRVPLATGLLNRTRETTTQQGLPASQRQSNLHGAFTLAKIVSGLKILLVDDVMTTTTTARECSRALRDGGAMEIHVAVLGRA
jgi:ComF family protein